MRSKWDLIDEKERAWMLRTALGINCGVCDEYLATEADFAKHFHIPDPRYKNLGECPNAGHDCAGEDEPGLGWKRYMTGTELSNDLGVDVEVWECRKCGRDWWHANGMFYDPAEWSGIDDILTLSNL